MPVFSAISMNAISMTPDKKYDVMMTTLLHGTGYVNNIFYEWQGGCERTPYHSFSLLKVISITRKKSQQFNIEFTKVYFLNACANRVSKLKESLFRLLCFSQKGTKLRDVLYQIKSNEKSSNNSKKIYSHTFISSALKSRAHLSLGTRKSVTHLSETLQRETKSHSRSIEVQ